MGALFALPVAFYAGGLLGHSEASTAIRGATSMRPVCGPCGIFLVPLPYVAN